MRFAHDGHKILSWISRTSGLVAIQWCEGATGGSVKLRGASGASGGASGSFGELRGLGFSSKCVGKS